MAQMLCYNYLKLWCILYAVLACIGDCKAREGLVILCCFLALNKDADDDADGGGGGGEDSADDDDGDA